MKTKQMQVVCKSNQTYKTMMGLIFGSGIEIKEAFRSQELNRYFIRVEVSKEQAYKLLDLTEMFNDALFLKVEEVYS